MEWLLDENKEFRYCVADTFESNMLVPIIRNMLYKAENGWDDYNEVYHCCRFIEVIRKNPSAKMNFHYVKKGEDTIGVGLITYGDINTLPSFPVDFHLTSSTDKILLFSYFHVSPEGRGIGEHWLRDIILPYYAGKGFESVYVKSSHPRVFSLYKRLGERVASYKSESDNGLYQREGEIFRISLLLQ